MIRPRTWWNPEGWDGNHVGCGVLDLPDTEFEHHNSHASAPDCMDFWYNITLLKWKPLIKEMKYFLCLPQHTGSL